MSEELIASNCCPSFYKATRCDNSCFRRAEAYISTDTFSGIAADRRFVRFGVDDDGDDLCWNVDKSIEFLSVPDGFTTITGLTAATDILDNEDKILLESASQDDAIYVICVACRKSDFDVILKGGSGTDYKVDDATKLSNFQKRYGSSTTDVSNQCLKPQNQYFAFDSRGFNIDGVTTQGNNYDAGTPGDPDPIAVGRFIKVSASLVDTGGSLASVYNSVVGNNAQETASNSSSVTNEIFRVIDIRRQTKPDTTNGPSYLKNIAAFFKTAGGTITTLPADCSDCLQAYLQTEGESGYATATMDTIIPFATAGDTYINLFNLSPSLWPCRVNIDRTFNMSTANTHVSGGQRDKIRSREGDIATGTPSATSVNCNDGSQSNESLDSFNFGYNTLNSFEPLPFEKSIFDAHRGDPTSAISTLKINTEYTKNLRMAKTSNTDTAPCGSKIQVDSLTDTSGVSATFDYLLNSVSITVSYATDPTVSDTPTIAIFPTTANQAALERDLLPAWQDTQPRGCAIFNNCTESSDLVSNLDSGFTSRPAVAGKFETTTPTIGFNGTDKVYYGRIGMTTNSGDIIPMLRYSKFYCNGNESAEQNKSPLTAVPAVQEAIDSDISRVGTIDLVVPLAPQVEIAAGFNVNGFKPTQQLTSTDRGRSDVASQPGGSGKCYPGKAHQSKFTFGSSARGDAITSLPFFLSSYAVGTGASYEYTDGDAKPFTGNNIDEFEEEFRCGGSETDGDIFIPGGPETKHTTCDRQGTCESSSGDYSSCRDIHLLTDNSFIAFFMGNNKYTQFDGTDTNVNFDQSDFLYAGNGAHFEDGALSGDMHEYIQGNGEIGDSINHSRIGVDSEWSSVFIEAQDPFARGCTGCLATEFQVSGADDNYTLMTDLNDNKGNENTIFTI